MYALWYIPKRNLLRLNESPFATKPIKNLILAAKTNVSPFLYYHCRSWHPKGNLVGQLGRRPRKSGRFSAATDEGLTNQSQRTAATKPGRMGASRANGGTVSRPAMHFFWQRVKRSFTHTHTLGFHKDTLPRSHAHRVVYVIYQVYACWPGRKSVSVCEWPNRVLPTALPGCQRLNPRPEDTTLLPARRPTTSPFWRQRIGCRTTGDRTTNHQSNRGLCALSRPYEGPKARHPGPQPETPSRLSIS